MSPAAKASEIPPMTVVTHRRSAVNRSPSKARASPPAPVITSNAAPSVTTAAMTRPTGDRIAPTAAPATPKAAPIPPTMPATTPKAAPTPDTINPSAASAMPVMPTAAATFRAQTTISRFWRIHAVAPTTTRVRSPARFVIVGASAPPMVNTPCLSTAQRVSSASLSSAASLGLDSRQGRDPSSCAHGRRGPRASCPRPRRP